MSKNKVATRSASTPAVGTFNGLMTVPDPITLPADVQLVRDIREQLSASKRWSKGSLHTHDGVRDTRCILGVVAALEGMEDMSSSYLIERQKQVKPVIDLILAQAKKATGRTYISIPHFNDAPETTHKILILVLLNAEQFLMKKHKLA